MKIKKLYLRAISLPILLLLVSCSQYLVTGYEALQVQHATKTEIDAIIQPYKTEIDREMNEVIGYSGMEMKTGFPEGLLGNFVSDLMLSSVRKDFKENGERLFSLTNNGGLRRPLPAGEITRKVVFEIMPFDNQVVVIKLDSQLMDKLFNYIINGDEMAIGGCRLTYRSGQLVKAEINEKEWDRSKSYFLVTTDYLANGGSGMEFLKSAETVWHTGILLRDMIIQYIADNQSKEIKIESKEDGRITID